MPPKRKPPTTFDEWLGITVENAARPHGGRAFLLGLLDWSPKSVERKTRGETPFLTSELTIVAAAIPGATVEEFITTALRGYGQGDPEAGIASTIAERPARPVSEGEGNVTPIRPKQPREDRAQEELDEIATAANHDAEHEQDEADPT